MATFEVQRTVVGGACDACGHNGSSHRDAKDTNANATPLQPSRCLHFQCSCRLYIPLEVVA